VADWAGAVGAVMPKSTESAAAELTVGSGNVFADLGFENPEQELMKARLTLEIFRLIRERGLTQTQAAEMLGIKQPQVSLLMRNRASSFSVGKLKALLTALGQDIQIVVKPAKREHGELSVLVG